MTMTPRSWLKSDTRIGILAPVSLYKPEIETLLALKRIQRIFRHVFPAVDPLTFVQNSLKTKLIIFGFFDIFRRIFRSIGQLVREFYSWKDIKTLKHSIFR